MDSMSQASKLVEYYSETAQKYDVQHSIARNPEHTRAMEIGWPLLGSPRSVLDVGSGTGRSLKWIEERYPGLKLFGLEPAPALLEIAKRNLPGADLRVGYGEKLPFDDNSIDAVIATAIMHHADDPPRIISEMFRVARLGVIISDHNNYAFGSELARRLRLILKGLGLLSVATFVKHGFKKQGYSEGDGWWYPYSLFDNYAQISSLSETVFVIPTRKPIAKIGNMITTQGHVAVVALKGTSR